MKNNKAYAFIGSEISKQVLLNDGIQTAIRELIYQNIIKFFVGCSTQFDREVFNALTSLKIYFPEIEICVVNNNFEEKSIEYSFVGEKVSFLNFVDINNLKAKVYKKMIDKSMGVVTFLHPNTTDAESKAVEYAVKQNKQIKNLYNFIGKISFLC